VPWVLLAASPQYREAWQVLRHNPVKYFQGHGPLNVGSFGYWRLLEGSEPFLTTEGRGGLPLFSKLQTEAAAASASLGFFTFHRVRYFGCDKRRCQQGLYAAFSF
jgi:hypothetical protein